MLQAPDAEQLLDEICQKLQAELVNKPDPALVGVYTGGVWVAQRLHERLGIQETLGTIDISFYRDDFDKKGLNPKVQASELPFNTEGRHIILVDDVVMTGRTTRAALNELFDYGRPASVTLVGLVDLAGKQLPICPDIYGVRLSLPDEQRIKLSGPNPLSLKVVDLEVQQTQ